MNLKFTQSDKRSNKKQLDPKSKNYKKLLAKLFIDGMRFSKIKPDSIARILIEDKIKSVFIGGTVVGCHSGQPRSTKDVDLIIPNDAKWKVSVSKICKLFKGSKVKKHPSFIEIYEKTELGDTELVDIVNVPNGSYGLAFSNFIQIMVNGVEVSIPTAEMMIVLKYTAAVNPIRERNKQRQDWIDIYNIIDGTKNISIYEVKILADSVVPGYGEDLFNKLRQYMAQG